jgi:hypothetical protein
MRRLMFWALLVSGILMIVLGIAEAHVHPTTLPVAHIVVASIFTLTTITHLTINRKAVIKYIKNG